MKLLQQSLRYNVIITITLLIVAGISMYYLLKAEITAEMREQLEYQADQIQQYLEAGQNVNYPLVEVEKVGNNISPYAIFKDSLLYDPLQKKAEDYYYLECVKANNEGNYKIKVMTTYIGWSEYSSTIFLMLFFTAILLTLLNILANYLLNKKIWTPFFQNLAQLKKFSVSSDEPIKLKTSGVVEFGELQKSLQDLADRGQKEYKALREFTENASHEMQTPLGIIQSKLDRMSQLDMNAEMAEYIVQARTGVERLKKLNKGLLLLAKLDNNAFPDKTEIRLDTAVQKQLELLEELVAGNGINITTNLEITYVFANPFLVDTLLSNLLSNAIRYTPSHHTIHISIIDGTLQISNPGYPLGFPEAFLFHRFIKGGQQTQTTGLGLSIVYQICQINVWEISYSYQQGQHIFSIVL